MRFLSGFLFLNDVHKGQGRSLHTVNNCISNIQEEVLCIKR